MLQNEGKVDPQEMDFLLKYAVAPEESPFPWLSNNSWGGIVALSKMEAFESLDKDIEGAHKRFVTPFGFPCCFPSSRKICRKSRLKLEDT